MGALGDERIPFIFYLTNVIFLMIYGFLFFEKFGVFFPPNLEISCS
jgi:quinol-cytochrome oxidoreductase complex cytochrome b subunit